VSFAPFAAKPEHLNAEPLNPEPHSIMKSGIVNVLSFDLEDWFHILDISGIKGINRWSEYEPKIENITFKILDILQTGNTKATFFVLGWIAERYPNLVRRIHNEGHEVGCHGYAHQLITTLKQKEFSNDLLKARDIIGNIIGRQPLSYRGPGFSITVENEWALEIIAERGFKYDSTIYPGNHGHGGHQSFTSSPVNVVFENSDKTLKEFPISVTRVFGKQMCFSGGGYLRLLPYFIIKKKIVSFNKQKNPVMVYLHPRDFDPDTPRLKMSFYRTLKCYINLNSTQKKFDQLLEDFDFTTLQSFCEKYNWDKQYSVKINTRIL
jgi:polysaccharide deacetylase family protein (PEP-CTERM system associated)